MQNFQSVAESNNFFDPGFKPSDLDHLPELYHRIIDDPAMLHDKVIQLQSKRFFYLFYLLMKLDNIIEMVVCMLTFALVALTFVENQPNH